MPTYDFEQLHVHYTEMGKDCHRPRNATCYYFHELFTSGREVYN